MLANQPMNSVTTDSAPAIDTAMLAELQDLLGTDFAPMMQGFLADLQQGLDGLRLAKADRDNTTGYDIAHRLKGASLNLGANALAEQCHTMQTLCQSGYIAESQATLAAIAAQAKRVQAQLLAMLPD